MRIRVLSALAIASVATCVSAQLPVITSFQPDGTITWTNMSTNCVAVVEGVSPATGGEWLTVYAELPSSTVSAAGLAIANGPAWFRVINADNSGAPTNMVLIPGGSNSGTNPLGAGESHTCFYPSTYSLSVGSLYMDRYEVTKAQWDEVANWAAGNGYDISAAGGSGKGPDHPVHDVTWYDCVKWCNARTEYENATQGVNRSVAYYTSAAKSAVYRTGILDLADDWVDWDHGYRLPTSTEWEYAARGGAVSRRFPWGGDTISHNEANYYARGYHPSYNSGVRPYTSPVGAFAANAYGLYDMAGNVWEWCTDKHPCFVGFNRVFRGGGWDLNANHCRVGFRYYNYPDYSSNNIGFRAVLPPGQ